MKDFFSPFAPLLKGFLISLVAGATLAAILGTQAIAYGLSWQQACLLGLAFFLPWTLLTPLLFRLVERLPLTRANWRLSLPVHFLVCVVTIIVCLKWPHLLLGEPPAGMGPPGRSMAPPHFSAGALPPPPRLNLARVVTLQLPIYLMLMSMAHLLVYRKNLQERTAANRANERLLSMISHDFQGPIANLKTVLDGVQAGYMSQSDFAEFTEDLRRDVDQLLLSVRNVMLWASQQMQVSASRSEQVSLRDAATDAVRLLSLTAKFKNIRIENTIEEKAMVWCDLQQICTVFRNLLANAIKFTPADGWIRLTAEEEPTAWVVRVRDTGAGIAPERLPTLFSPTNFGQPAGTRRGEGLGLGLQICRDSVLANKGTIWVESEVGKGTNFYFRLPKFSQNSDA